jgi:beta-glucosidase
VKANADAARLLRGAGAPVATIHGLTPGRTDTDIWASWTEPDVLEPFDLIGFTYATSAIGDGGLGEILHRLGDELPGRALLVSAHGVGTTDDALRVEILRESLTQVEEAIDDGIDVRGFFHWTAVDGYEWLRGYELPFGLFDRDRNARGSAALMGSAAASVGGPAPE